MKRSALKRTASLKRTGAALARRTPLAKGKALRPGKRRQKAQMSRTTAGIVASRQHGLCACGCGEPIGPFPIGFHHVFPKAQFPALADIAENIVGLAENCHANHEARSHRLARSVVAPAEMLAATWPMRNYLARTYAD